MLVEHFKWQPRGKRRIHQQQKPCSAITSILRSDDREAELALLVEDLRRVADALRSG